jgi:hypothetical protein
VKFQPAEERRGALKPLIVSCAVILFLGLIPGAAGGAEDTGEKAARDAFNTQVALYIKTTQSDLKSNINFPKASVTLLSSDIQKTDSLVTPYKGKIEYVVEFDSPAEKGQRKSHPYVMRCKYFNGKWDIDPHGHARKKNLEDLSPPVSKLRVSPDV